MPSECVQNNQYTLTIHPHTLNDTQLHLKMYPSKVCDFCNCVYALGMRAIYQYALTITHPPQT